MKGADTVPYDPEDSTIGQGQVRAGASDPMLILAWNQFYEHCFDVIRRCPGVRRLNEFDRDDCVQEVMVELVRRFGEAVHLPTPDPAQFVGLIKALSRNKAADIVRRKVRRPETQFTDGAGIGLDGPDDPVAPDRAGPDPGEYVALVWEALVALDHEVPVTSYLVFYLHTIENWPYEEIGDLFEIKPEQARVRCHRVKKKFTALLEQRRGPEGAGPS